MSFPSEKKISLFIDKGWTREDGFVKGTNLKWMSFESPNKDCMYSWQEAENGFVHCAQFNPNQIVNLIVKELT